MGIFIAVLLLGIAILLFVAVRKQWIDGATLQIIANIGSAVACLAAIALFVIPSFPSTINVPTESTVLVQHAEAALTLTQDTSVRPTVGQSVQPTQIIARATDTLKPFPTDTLIPSHTSTSQVQAEDLNWTTEYYDNREFSGLPVLTTTDVAINFDWGEISPAISVPVDFAVHWKKCLNFEDRYYDFYTQTSTNDRVWVYLDDTLVNNGGASSFLVPLGRHCLEVYFLDFGYYASLEFNFKPGKAAPATDLETSWTGEYFDNNQLDGIPVFTRYDPVIDFDWGEISPAIGVPDNFSARWTRCLNFEDRYYDFYARASTNDLVRVYLDGTLINKGGDSKFLVPAGRHCLQVDYLDFGYGASVEFIFK